MPGGPSHDPPPLIPEDLTREVGRALVSFLLAVFSVMRAIGRFTVDIGAMAAAANASPAANSLPPTRNFAIRVATPEEVATGGLANPPELGKQWYVVTTGKKIGIFDDW